VFNNEELGILGEGKRKGRWGKLVFVHLSDFGLHCNACCFQLREGERWRELESKRALVLYNFTFNLKRKKRKIFGVQAD